MSDYQIRPATREDVNRLHDALAALSAHMGDTHAATAAMLERHGFGQEPAFHALLAENGDHLAGVVVFSPLFSTVQGCPGLYVSDLWVSPQARGSGLGRQLLAASLTSARNKWGAAYLKLAVYHDNHAAAAFYEKLGFVETTAERYLMLTKPNISVLEDNHESDS